MTPIQASKKTNENLNYSNLQYKSKNLNSKIQLGHLDIKKVFPKGDSTNYS